MKKIFLIILIAKFLGLSVVCYPALLAQAPQGLNYQAVARNATGDILANQPVSFRFTITNGNAGSIQYQETQSGITNQFGLISLHVGEGTPISGTFSTVPWASINAWLQVEMDPSGGITYTDMGTSPLLSVPYALYAASGNQGPPGEKGDPGIQGPPGAQGPPGILLGGTSAGNTPYWDGASWITNSSNIFNNGGNIGINTTNPIGKLHIVGSNDVSQFIVDANSVQSNSNPLIRLRKSNGVDLMGISSDDATNTYVGLSTGKINDPAGGGINNTFIGSEAGFSNISGSGNTAVGSASLYNNGGGFLNTSIGINALRSNTSGSQNTASGQSALFRNTAGNNNAAIGGGALYNNTIGENNTVMGNYALFSNVTGSNATAIGYRSMFYSNSTETAFTNYNVALGFESLRGSGTASNNTGNYNTAIGYQTLWNNTSGDNNTANGYYVLYSNTTGTNNTANGWGALSANTIGSYNVAMGVRTLYSNTEGSQNLASGQFSLYSNTTGSLNSATGSYALYSNTIGIGNTANGDEALYSNVEGNANTAIGTHALYSNVTGSNGTAIGTNAMQYSNNSPASFINHNVAVGFEALRGSAVASNTGNANTAIGYQALLNNITGVNNTATGWNALVNNVGGFANTANGYQALFSTVSGVANTALGYTALYANITGSFNTALGRGAYFTSEGLDNTTCIGYNAGGMVNTSNRIEVGNSSITFIGGQVAWSTYSDERIKDNVTEDIPGLEFVMRLRPVMYNLNIHRQNELAFTGGKEIEDWPTKYDIENVRMSGFIAQEVEQAAREEGYDFSGVQIPGNPNELYSLRYSDFVVPLTKAIQEQQQIIEQQNEVIEELKDQNQELQAQINEIKKRVGLE